MPETIDAPAATTAAPTTAPAAAPAPAARGPADETFPGSFRRPNPAFDAMASRVAKKGKPLPTQQALPEAAPQPKPPQEETAATSTEESGSEESTDQTEQASETAQPEKTEEQATKPAEATKKEKKLSPWRLLDDAKKVINEWKLKAEAASAELEKIKSGAPVEPPKEFTERLTKAEARAKELEDHLRFLDYQKHPEFIDKYQKPYEAAWKRAMAELGEVGVTDATTGQVRAATADDMMKLVTLPLGAAIQQAKEMFGEYAPYAIDHRNKIKELFDSQQNALKEAREGGAKREQEMQEKTQAQRSEAAKAIQQVWEQENRAISTDSEVGHYFTPVEGDQEGNTALVKGYQLVDKAFAENPQDPNITPEERAARIKRHVALRNRAAAFGRLRRWHEKDQATIAELKKELEQFKQSEPGSTTTTRPAKEPSQPSDPWKGMEQRLRQKAAH